MRCPARWKAAQLPLDTTQKASLQRRKLLIEEAVALIVKRCNNAEAGGRIIDAILTNTVLPHVSIEYLTRMSRGDALKEIELTAADGDFVYRFG